MAREVEVQAEEEQNFLAKQQAALLGLKDPTRSPTTRNQASTGPVIQVIPFIIGACFSYYVQLINNHSALNNNNVFVANSNINIMCAVIHSPRNKQYLH